MDLIHACVFPGKRGHLLSKSLADGDELSAFLNSDNVQYLSWLHEIRRGNFEAVRLLVMLYRAF